MDKPRIFATPKDYDHKREFCSVYVDVSAAGLKVMGGKNVFISRDSRNGDLRIQGGGCIQYVPLGELIHQSSSIGFFTGYIHDYAENYEIALAEGRRQAIKMRDRFAAQAAEAVAKFLKLEVEVTGE